MSIYDKRVEKLPLNVGKGLEFRNYEMFRKKKQGLEREQTAAAEFN